MGSALGSTLGSGKFVRSYIRQWAVSQAVGSTLGNALINRQYVIQWVVR